MRSWPRRCKQNDSKAMEERITFIFVHRRPDGRGHLHVPSDASFLDGLPPGGGLHRLVGLPAALGQHQPTAAAGANEQHPHRAGPPAG